jgi:peptide/nickel transport system permease protein
MQLRDIKSAPATAWFGMIIVTCYIAVACLAPVLAPYGETEIVGASFSPWGSEFWFGTDNLGRDILSRLIYGARNTVGIAFVTTVFAFLLGGSMGLIAATVGGVIEQLFSRIVDLLMSIPALLFALLLLTIFGAGAISMILIIAVLDSTRVYRLTRAVAMNVVAMEYVEAARMRGEGLIWLVRREILPAVRSPLIAEFGLRFCFVFLTISALSFLGLGIQPPTADWGSMVREYAPMITFGELTPLLPAGVIALLTVSVNLIVDWFLHKTSGLRDEK